MQVSHASTQCPAVPPHLLSNHCLWGFERAAPSVDISRWQLSSLHGGHAWIDSLQKEGVGSTQLLRVWHRTAGLFTSVVCTSLRVSISTIFTSISLLVKLAHFFFAMFASISSNLILQNADLHVTMQNKICLCVVVNSEAHNYSVLWAHNDSVWCMFSATCKCLQHKLMYEFLTLWTHITHCTCELITCVTREITFALQVYGLLIHACSPQQQGTHCIFLCPTPLRYIFIIVGNNFLTHRSSIRGIWCGVLIAVAGTVSIC